MAPNPNMSMGRWSPATSGAHDTGANAKSGEGNSVSSYTSIWKFPSYRKSLFHNAVDYMAAKHLDEGLGPGLWRVHDGLYDLRPFARRHPGGSEWIAMTEGTDITEAFETSHVLNTETVHTALAKYRVRAADGPRNSPFTFTQDGFYRTLQRRVAPVLRAEGGTGPRRSVLLLQDTLAALFVLLTVVSVGLDSFWLQVLAGLALAWTVVCAHNFFHIRENWRKFYFDLSFVSSFEWRLGHALSHHLFPNTVLDYEVYLMEPWTELSAGKRRSLPQRTLSHLYLYVLYSQFFGMELVKRIVAVFIRRSQPPRPENFLPLVHLLLNMYLTGSMLGGFRTTFVIHSVASFYFACVGTATASHHHPDSFHEGDRVRKETDFGLCQLDVVKQSQGAGAHNMLMACVTFGEHPLHHLFPTVCHSKLQALQSTVEAVLKEFREEIQTLSSLEKYAGIHRQLNRQTRNDFTRRVRKSE